MSHTPSTRCPSRRDWVIACAIFLATVLLAAVAGRGKPPGRADALLAAAVIAVGTWALSAWSVRFARYPRWAYWTSAAVLSAIGLTAAGLMPDLGQWKATVASSLWLYPWYPMVLAVDSARSRVCAAGTVLGGWLMVGAAAVVGAAAPAASLLLR